MIIAAQDVPHFVVRGKPATLTLPLEDEKETPFTADPGGTVSIWLGSKQIITDEAVDVGPPASYVLDPSSYSAEEGLLDRVLAVWDLEVGGIAYGPFRTHGYFLRRPPVCQCTLGMLREIHPTLVQRFPRAPSFLVAAWKQVLRDAVKKGLRPQLVQDGWIFVEPTRWKALQLTFADAAQNLGSNGTKYQERADEYAGQYVKAWEETRSNAYDWGQTGTIDPGDSKPLEPSVLYLSRKPWSSSGGR
jgi:hypothetical protein